jgi:hypothetical protein
MPVKPHRFLSPGCLISLAGKAWQDQDGMRHAQAQGALFKKPEEKGVVNSKLLPVTRALQAKPT